MKKRKNIVSQPTKRKATSEECLALFTYLATTDWQSSVTYASTIGHEDVQLGYTKFLKREIKGYQSTIGDAVLIDHFDDCNISLYVYFYSMFDPKTNNHWFTTNSVLRVNNDFQKADGWDYFNLDDEINKLGIIPSVSPGRPKRPSDTSVIKTHNIRLLIKDGMLVDDACAKEGLAKSTYYRVSKWIVANSVFKSFPK